MQTHIREKSYHGIRAVQFQGSWKPDVPDRYLHDFRHFEYRVTAWARDDWDTAENWDSKYRVRWYSQWAQLSIRGNFMLFVKLQRLVDVLLYRSLNPEIPYVSADPAVGLR